MSGPVTAWISPWDTYQSVAEVVADVEIVRAALPGREVRVALPTAYGPALQGTLARPGQRTLGDALCPPTPDGLRALRQQIEAAGVPCDGWCVPRGDGDVAAEGDLHGRLAGLFDKFILNFEAGWPGFWTRPADVAATNGYLTAFWDALGAAGRADALTGEVGLTWVTNSMLAAVPDDAKRAWIDGTHYDALEVYVPGDPNLDPARGLARWQQVLGRLGVTGRDVVAILARGDLVADAATYSHPTRGVQLWTLQSAARRLAQVAPAPPPAPEPAPDPARETPADYPFPTWRESAIAYRGALDAMGQQCSPSLLESYRQKFPGAQDWAGVAANLEGIIRELQAQVKQLTTDVAMAEAERNDLAQQLATCQRQAATLQGNLAACEAALERARSAPPPQMDDWKRPGGLPGHGGG